MSFPVCESFETDSRRYYLSKLDSCSSPKDFESFIEVLSSLEIEQLEYALPCLCDFFEKAPSSGFSLEKIIARYLLDSRSTRGGRKACYSCLKEMKPNALWNNFFVIIETLEEPQFHLIKAVLPLVDNLITVGNAEVMSFQWTSMILTRALLHSNGWIRLWAIEKFTEIPTSILSENSSFIFEWIFPALNCNDIYWRLLERDRLTSFISAIGSQLENIIQDPICNPGQFIRQLLQGIESMSCPVSFFFMAKVLSYFSPRPILKGDDVFPLFRRVLTRASYIPHISLRVATCYHFVSFFSNIVEWTREFISDFGKLTSFFSSDAPLIFQRLLQKVVPLWNFSLDIKEIVLPHEEDFYKIIGKRILLSDYKQCILEELWTSFESIEPIENKDAIIRTLTNCNSALTQIQIDRVFEFIQQKIVEGAAYSDIENIYLPFIKNYKPDGFKALLDCICKAKNELTSRIEPLLIISFLQYSEKDCSTWLQDNCKEEDFLKIPSIKRNELSPKEYNSLQAKIQTLRLKIYSKTHFPNRSAVQDIKECLGLLDCASASSVKVALLSIISQKISLADVAPLLEVISSAAAVVNEEKKSQFCLPAITKMFEICTKKEVLLKNLEVEAKCKELFEEFSSLAALSHPIALVLANVLESMETYLPTSWAKQVLTIATFGPIPKKDNKVLNAAYSLIYSELGEDLPNFEFERIHEIAQRTRMKAICTALRCSEKNEEFANSLIDKIIKESNALDKSSSKSFGLSLAHRAKTRLVALLLFLMETVSGEKKIVEAVFDHCMSCILDPCQQYSIKLIVEWIMVRLCLRFPAYKEKLIKLEKYLASKRIGAVSSWINMMVHLTRVSEDEEFKKKASVLILAWTSAQNFAVRCSAIAGLTLIYNSFPERMKKENELLASVVNFDSEPAGNARRIIENLLGDFYFSHLNMQEDLDLQAVFIEISTKTGLPLEETIPVALLLELNTTRFRSLNKNNDFLNAPTLVYGALLKNSSSAPDIEVNEDVMISSDADSVQKKIITKEKTKNAKDHSLIVVASLIDKPNNLGGLTRTSEIFGVDKIVLSDLLLVNDSNFQALSMSAEKWQKFEAVRPENLLPYLEGLRSMGYTVIAAEQATDSIPLHRFNFPKKSVLLMGDEKEGVPTKLLRAVDQTVEISQLGQTRSLNVHVTAALFISRYAEQLLL